MSKIIDSYVHRKYFEKQRQDKRRSLTTRSLKVAGRVGG